MAITANSRYTTAVLQTVDAPNGTVQEMRVPFPTSRRISYTYYRVVEGERIDNVAYDFYKNGQLWWMIANANPEIMDWMNLEAGTVLRVPNA